MSNFNNFERKYIFSGIQVRKVPRKTRLRRNILRRPRLDFLTNSGLRITVLDTDGSSWLNRFPRLVVVKTTRRRTRGFGDWANGFALDIKPRPLRLAQKMLNEEINDFVQWQTGWHRDKSGGFTVHTDNNFRLAADEGVAVLNMIIQVGKAFEVGGSKTHP